MTSAEHLDMPSQKTEFKDESPLNTVAQIKNILQQHGIHTTERWMETTVPYCFAVRVTVEGTNFGVNGKGLTKEFTLASGYGELMERLQLGFIGSLEVQKGGHLDHHVQYTTVPAAQLLEENASWFEHYIRHLSLYSDTGVTAEQILQTYTDSEGNVPVTPYYNVVSGKTAYLPAVLQTRVYGTTGCAAGNTPEEAIVQAVSEIVERHHQLRMFEQNIVLPDIPEEVLQQHKAAYNIITFVRQNGIRVMVKDCSLGEKFPVVCACFIDEKTGRYHTHFGAHPAFSIALERALTESFQGNDLSTLTKIQGLIYEKGDGKTPYNVIHELCCGTGEKAASFFVGTPTYPYNTNVGFTGQDNKALLRECVAFFTEQGYDFLVRNGASLGFPTCQVIVPGYSEVYIYRLSPEKDDHRYSSLASAAFRNPAKAGTPALLGCLMHMKHTAALPKEMFNVHGFLATAKLAATANKEEDNFLYSATQAHIFYTLGKFGEVNKCMEALLKRCPAGEQAYLLCLQRYLSLKQNGYDPAAIRKLLEVFHSNQVIDLLDNCIDSNGNPFDKYVLHCNMQCDAGCRLYPRCCQKRIVELSDLVGNNLHQLDAQQFASHVQSLLS